MIITDCHYVVMIVMSYRDDNSGLSGCDHDAYELP